MKCYEILKCGGEKLLDDMVKLFNTNLETGLFPDLWGDAIITPIHKSGSINTAENYRGISLLCIMGKLFTKVLNNRLIACAEKLNKIDEGQAAYRKGRRTTDNIFTLYAMAEKYLSKKGGRFYCAYIDFSWAFDNLPHSHLWYRLVSEGVHGKFLRVLQSMYRKLRSSVKTSSGLSDFFRCLNGTRQGCMISPALFIMYVNELAQMLRDMCPGLYVSEQYPSVHILVYADDLTLVNDTVGRVQNELNVLNQFCQNYGMTVNLKKSKVILFRNGGYLRQNERLYYGGQLLKRRYQVALCKLHTSNHRLAVERLRHG